MRLFSAYYVDVVLAYTFPRMCSPILVTNIIRNSSIPHEAYTSISIKLFECDINFPLLIEAHGIIKLNALYVGGVTVEIQHPRGYHLPGFHVLFQRYMTFNNGMHCMSFYILIKAYYATTTDAVKWMMKWLFFHRVGVLAGISSYKHALTISLTMPSFY